MLAPAPAPLMTQPRNDTVRLRLTTLEKSDWTRAAGGARRLSEWIRATCNARVAELADAAASSTAAERREGSTTSPSIPNAKPVIVGDAIEREVKIGQVDKGRGGHSTLVTGGQRPDERPKALAPEDQAHRESRSLSATGEPGDDSKGEARNGGGGESCPRWMHHRPGVYCGSCKRVIGKLLK